MEKKCRSSSSSDGGNRSGSSSSWWALATSVQLVAGIASFRRGYNGDSSFMPFKAFAVASLFVGAGATSIAGFLHASGITRVEDLKKVGSNIRNGLGIPPRPREAN